MSGDGDAHISRVSLGRRSCRADAWRWWVSIPVEWLDWIHTASGNAQ